MRARWRLAAVLVLLLLVPIFSGCLTLDELMASRKKPRVPEEPGELRVWFAAKPNALPEEFRHFNITVDTIVQMVDLGGDSLNLLRFEERTIDLAYLSREKKAVLAASGTADEGFYYGVLYTVGSSELGVERVVGNEDGEAVKRVDMRPLVVNDAPATIQVDHNMHAGKTTDVYIEYDPDKALVAEGNGQYSYTHGVIGASVYVDGLKVKDQDMQRRGTPAKTLGDSYRGSDDSDDDVGPSGPRPRMRVQDAWDNDLTATARAGRLVPRAVGLEEPLHFDTVTRLGRANVASGNEITETIWDFADGTRSLRPSVVKAYDGGGIFDASMRTREANGRTSTDFVTFFVPYRADEAVAVEEDARAGTLVLGTGPASNLSVTSHDEWRMTFPGNQSAGRYALGGYRITATFDPVAAEDEDRFLGLTQMRMNVSSGLLQESVVGSSPLVLETAGVPKHTAGIDDWVENVVDIELGLDQGTLVDYDLRVEALYFANLSRGLDHHGQHRHGTWHFFQPYVDHLAYDGTLLAALPDEDDEDDGDGDDDDGPLPP